MKKSKLIRTYIYNYRRIAVSILVFAVIYAAVFSLYNIEFDAVLYASLLCLLVGIIALAVHFRSYYMKYKEREHILNNILIMTESLPEPDTLAEENYQEMIRRLKRANSEIITKYQTERRESIDYYTAWVHQIKTPISVMHMLLEYEDSAEHRELSAELFRIEQYVEMVLCYLRLDSDSSDFVFRSYPMDEIIRSCIRKYASQFVRKRISLKYEPANINVLTDEKWMSFIIEQILSNAVKYTEKGTVTIKVTEDKVLSISDTGIGISSEDIPRIFERGFTGYNGRAHKKSTGLGLYLAKKAADNLSHKISVESEAGKGSTFYIDLNSDKIGVE